jgi:peptide/nickel transport system substrate-binding protein
MKRQFFTILIVSIFAFAILLAGCAQPATPAPEEPAAEEPAAEEPAVEEPAAEEPVVEEPAAEEPAAEEPAETEMPAEEESPSKLIVAINGQPSRLLPSKSVGRLNEILNSMTFEALTTHDENNDLVGLLAESFTSLDDTTWEFKLRPDITFSNGTPLTAEDVEFTYEQLILNPDMGSPHATFMSTIEEVEVIDPLTLHIITSQPDVLLPLRVFDIYGSVVSKEHYESFANEADYDADPIGTGPYKLVEWVKDSHITYERNENYWGDAPAYDVIEVRFISDETTRVNALLAGEVDIANNIPPVRIEEVEGNEDLEVVITPSNRVHFMVTDTTKPPFDNEDVRMAVSMAIDREALINAVQFSYGTATPSIFMPETFGYDTALVPVYDPEQAKQLLADAGYPDGFETEFDTFTGSITDHSKTAEAVAGMLAKVGIIANLNVDEITNWGPKRLANETSPIYNYSFGDALFDHGPNLNTFVSGENGFYYSGDEELNALIDQALAEFDIEKRAELYSEIQRQFYEKGILTGLYQMKQVWGTKSDVEYIPQVDEMWRLFDAKPKE